MHQHLARFAISNPLQDLLLPEMPFAPPESDYGDSEAMENLEQLRQQRRDTLVAASGSSGSPSQPGQMAGIRSS